MLTYREEVLLYHFNEGQRDGAEGHNYQPPNPSAILNGSNEITENEKYREGYEKGRDQRRKSQE